MSHNIGRQAHRAEQNIAHRELDSDIADTKFLLNASAQTAKNLKVRLKELTDKKKETGKSPRKSQAASNKFDIPIPKIRANTTITAAFASESSFNPCSSSPLAIDKNTGMSDMMPVDVPFANRTETQALAHHDKLSQVVFQPPVPTDAPTSNRNPNTPVGTPYNSDEARYHPRFELPPFDLDLFNMALENEPVAEPTAEEVAAYQFLKYTLGK